MKLSEHTSNLKTLVNSVLQTIKPLLQEKKIQLVLEFDEKIENDLIGDYTYLTQILTYILTIAVKFTEKGKIGIQVSLLNSQRDLFMTEIKIYNSEIGLNPQKLGRIFDSVKLDYKDVIEKYDETKSNLATVKQLINLNGGEITVESTLQGITFAITLPLKDGKQQSKKLHSNQDIISENWKNYNILVVEDNLLNQKYVANLLKKWQINYEIANHGLEALEILQNIDFDMILMDIWMPEMDGFDTIKAIRQFEGNSNQHIPIIALTALSNPDEIDFAFKMGMNSYLTKPFTQDQLHEILEQKLSLNPNRKVTTVKKTTTLPITEIIDIENEILQSDYLTRIYNNDRNFAAEMFDLFLKTVPKQFSLLKPLVEAQKKNEIGNLAHQLKPSFAMVGLPEITQKLQVLEKKAKSNENFDIIKQTYNEIDNIFNRKIGLVEKEFGKLK